MAGQNLGRPEQRRTPLVKRLPITETPNDCTIERLMYSFWSGRSPHTVTSYRLDIEDFCRFLSTLYLTPTTTPQLELLRQFFNDGAGHANGAVLDYRNQLRVRDAAPGTINRRLSAIRSLVRLARLIGMVWWTIEVENVRGELSRDTTGPTTDIVTALLEHAASEARPPLRTRNIALLRLLFDLGLRVAEVTHLDVADYDAKQGGLWIKGKGRTRKERLQLPAPTRQALQDWLTIRGRAPGQLLRSFSRNSAKDGRLCTRGVYRIVRNLGADIGIHLHPHMLRHSAITEAVNRSVGLGLSLDQVRDFSRHKNINTLLIYRDRHSNNQSALATAVSSAVKTDKEAR